MNRILASVALLFLINGCVTDSSATNGINADKYNILKAEEDALSALDKRDFRFMALSLRGIVIPGVDSAKTLQYELRCGINLMQGVTDAVRTKEQLKMMQQAHDYAAKYNAIIKTRCNP